MEFTLDAYVDLISLIREKDYDICDYHNYLRSDKYVIMRHDIDFDLEKAAAMAELEQQLNVKSVYFILLSTDFYNLMSEKNTGYIKRIMASGHEIGLHFDETKYSNCGMEHVKEAIFDEVKTLEMILGRRVESVSMHRPSQKMLESNLDLDYVINTYGKVFFHDIKYVSDARMHYNENIEEILNKGETRKIQLLTHPFWYSDKEETITEKLRAFALRASEERYMGLSSNMRDIDSILSREELYGNKNI